MKKIKDWIAKESVQLFLILLFFGMIAIFAMHMDDVQSGDEVITYSAANSTVDVWMFALDRPSHWVRDVIYDSSLPVTIKNGMEAIKDVYINGENTLLYYLLVHTVSSFFPEYSFSKWCAFGINLLFFMGILFVFYKLCKKYSLSKHISFVLIALYVCTNGLRIATYLRAYQMLIFFVLFLFYQHILRFESIEKKENFPSRRFFVLLGIV